MPTFSGTGWGFLHFLPDGISRHDDVLSGATDTADTDESGDGSDTGHMVTGLVTCLARDDRMKAIWNI